MIYSVKTKIIICSLLSLSIFLGGGALRKTVDTYSASVEYNNVSSPERYIARNTDGFIGIYREGASEPCEMLEVRIEYLPETDRKMLDDGIVLNSREELISLIEDYTG